MSPDPDSSSSAPALPDGGLAAVLAQLTDAVAVVGMDGRTMSVNAAAQRLLGLSTDTSSITDYGESAAVRRVDGTLLPRAEWPIVRALGGELIRNQEMVLHTPSGETTAVAASAVPLVGADGVRWGAALVVREVNEELRLRATLDDALHAAERRAAEQGALAAALADVVGAVEVDEQLARIARRAHALVSGDYAAVAVVDDGGRTIWRAIDGNRSDAWRAAVFAEGRGTAGRVIASDRPLIITGFPDNPDFPPEEFPAHVGEGMRSALGVPLRADGRVYGAVVVGWRRPEHVSEQHVALVQSLADVAAIALSRSRLLASLDRRAVELEDQRARLSTENERLRQLVRVTGVIAETLDPVHVTDAVLDGIGAGLLGADAVSLYLYDTATHELYGRRSRYLGGTDAQLARLRAAHGRRDRTPLAEDPLLREVIEGRRAVLVPDAAAGHPLMPRDLVETYGVGSVLAVPLSASGEALGALVLTTLGRPMAYRPEAVAFVESLGGAAAAALYNARSFQELEVQRDALEEANVELEQSAEELHSSAQQLELQSEATEQLNAQLRERNVQLDHRVGELDAVLDQMADGVLIVDASGEFVRVNPAAERIYGRSLRGLAIADWVRELSITDPNGETVSDGSLPTLVALRERRVVDAAEWRARRADGAEIRLLGSSAPLYGREGQVVGAVTVYRDITERTRLIEQVQRATKLKERFFAQMSHELRTPINAILGYTQLIQDGLAGEVAPKAADMIGRVNRSGRHLLELVNDVLDISRLEAGKVQIECVDFDLVENVRDTLMNVEPQAAAKGLALHVDAVEHIAVHSDPARVRQIILNLASNAVKFTARGEVRVRAADRGDGYVVIDVADTGTGIAPEHLENVFAEFVQVGNRADGTGLGLAISRRLAALLGGTLTLTSELGRGSVFTLTLPAVREPPPIQ